MSSTLFLGKPSLQRDAFRKFQGLKALVKTQNLYILQYSDWYWLLLSVNIIHQLLTNVQYTIPRKAKFTKRCFQKISGVLHRISLEKLKIKVFHICFLVFTFLLLVLSFIADASMMLQRLNLIMNSF